MAHSPEGNGNGNGRSGRNVALPDENRPSWRPQDEAHRNRRVLSEEEDGYEQDRWRHWDERDQRDYEARGRNFPGAFEDRYRDRGGSAYYERPPERIAQRGYGYSDGGDRERDRERERERPSPRYGYSDDSGGRLGQDRQNLGTGGAMHREHTQGSTGAHGNAVPGHRGKGPMNYQRSDERIREIVCEALTEDDRVDASSMEVAVKNGEVTLTGTVEDRTMKRLVEDIVESVSGVRELQNLLRIAGERTRHH